MAENRVTQEILQVLHDGADSEARVSQIILQVLYLPTAVSLEDDLDNFADSVIREFYAPPGVITQDLSDNWVVSGGKPPRYQWGDGFELQLDGVDPQLYISVDELYTSLADELELELTLFFTDTLALSDTLEAFAGYSEDIFDSIFYTIADNLESIPDGGLSQDLSDYFNTLTDALDTDRPSDKVLSDSISLSSSLSLLFDYYLSLSDTATLLDATGNLQDTVLALAETISLSDVLDAGETLPVSQDIADTLALSDAAINTYVPVSDLDYIRRHLEDLHV